MDREAVAASSHFGVIVESRLSGAAAGQMMVNVAPTATVDTVIATFCVERGIRQRAAYVLRTPGDVVLENTRTLHSLDIGDGDTLYLSTRGPGDDVFGFSNWGVMAAISLVIGLVGLVAISWIYSATGDVANDYAIVFDAGSTHTSMFVYRWPGSKLNGTGVPTQTHSCKVAGGPIDSYVGRDDQLASNLKTCVDDGKSSVAGGKVATTPLMLGATGGMRILQIKNESASKEILGTVDKTFSASGFEYKSGMARIINGSEEATGVWITANFLLNKLTQAPQLNSSTMGTLDLGGASTQYAVEVPVNDTLNGFDVNVKLYSRGYNLSTDSALCFGQVQAANRRTAQLLINWNGMVVEDPCLPSGYNYTIPVAQAFSSPCTAMSSSLIPKYNSSTNVTFVGTSMPDECTDQTAALFNGSTCASVYQYQQCFTNRNLGNLHKPFMAISLFYEVMQLYNMTEFSTLEQFSSAVEDVCNRTWEQLEGTQALDTWPPQLSCFAGQYVQQLLTNGYGFDNSTWTNLSFVQSINGAEVGWTLGFAIRVTNMIPAEMPAEPIQLPVFICLVITFLVFIALAAAFSVHAWRKERRAPTYQRLSQYGAI